MKRVFSKHLFAVLLVIAIVSSFGSVVFAQANSGQTYSTQTVNAQGYVENNVQFSNDPNKTMTEEEARAISNAGLANVTIDEASGWAERKGFEVVGFLQTFVQPFAVVIFIVCAMMALVGAFGNSSLVGKGIVGMMIAVVMYAVVLYAPELMEFFMNWLRT